MPRPERYDSAAAAVADIPDGSSILVAGFHAGVPWNLMQALWEQGASDLLMISTTVNRPLRDEDGRVTIADLVLAGRVRKVIASFTAAPHPSQPNAAEDVFREGGAEAELVPQGTVAERIRAGGAGIPAFYTPAGVGSAYAASREQREFDGRSYVLERGITADYAFVRAHQADEAGNLLYRRAARNFNPIMATAGRCTIAEVDEPFLKAGEIDPDQVHTPGVYVARLVHIAEGRINAPRRTRRSGRELDLDADDGAGGAS
ncbi:MAG: 3-oxoacid CoA-transferase subunit A [Chloroflexi bacterium]|nr:3-oxoacid CoA-transferase subunit A [Chloroflexota bacterium]